MTARATVPDISLEAACHTPGAFSVFPDQLTGNSVVCCVCGTSLGAPVWAGITELMVQNNSNERLGSINTKLYELGNMRDTATTGIRDVTMGNNDYNGVTGFDAVPGYDQASGWGTPDVATFVMAFLGQPSATSTPTPTPTPATPTATPTATPNGAVLSVPSSLTAAATGIGESSKKSSFTIKNAGKKGAGPLTGTVISSNPSIFGISPGGSFSLAVGKSLKEIVTFSPIETANSATATISTNAGTVNMQLNGTGLPGVLSAPKSFSISGKVGVTTPGKITIKNAGEGVLTGSWGALSAPYKVTSMPFTLAPGKPITIPITFTATAKGSAPPASLAITVTSVGGVNATIPIQGTGK